MKARFVIGRDAPGPFLVVAEAGIPSPIFVMVQLGQTAAHAMEQEQGLLGAKANRRAHVCAEVASIQILRIIITLFHIVEGGAHEDIGAELLLNGQPGADGVRVAFSAQPAAKRCDRQANIVRSVRPSDFNVAAQLRVVKIATRILTVRDAASCDDREVFCDFEVVAAVEAALQPQPALFLVVDCQRERSNGYGVVPRALFVVGAWGQSQIAAKLPGPALVDMVQEVLEDLPARVIGVGRKKAVQMMLGGVIIFHFIKRGGELGADTLQPGLLRQHVPVDPNRLLWLTAAAQDGGLEEAGPLLGKLSGERIFLHCLFELVQLQICNQARVILQLPALMFGPRRLFSAVLIGGFRRGERWMLCGRMRKRAHSGKDYCRCHSSQHCKRISLHSDLQDLDISTHWVVTANLQNSNRSYRVAMKPPRKRRSARLPPLGLVPLKPIEPATSSPLGP